MTPESEADALALLRAGAEYGGHDWWHGLLGLGFLKPPYCDTLLGALTRRLRADGWRFGIRYQAPTPWSPDGSWGAYVGSAGSSFAEHKGTDPERAVLALGRAMRDAGIISTEAQA